MTQLRRNSLTKRLLCMKKASPRALTRLASLLLLLRPAVPASPSKQQAAAAALRKSNSEKRKTHHLMKNHERIMHNHHAPGNVSCHATSATTCTCSGPFHHSSESSQLKGIDARFLAATQSGCSPESISSLLSFVEGGTVKKKALTLVTTIKSLHDNGQSTTRRHDLEVLLALAENVCADAIEAVVVLVDGVGGGASQHSGDEGDAYATAMLKDAIYAAAMAHWKGGREDEDDGRARRELLEGALTQKLSGHIFGEQPTYWDMFQFADTSPLVGPGKLVAIANADVVLRHGERLDPELFHPSNSVVVERSSEAAGGGAVVRHFELQPRPLALVLSVVPRQGAHGCNVVNHCTQSKVGLSWDVHIYESPLRNPAVTNGGERVTSHRTHGRTVSDALNRSLLEGVYMNMIGAENRAGFFLHHAGYQLANPCSTVVAEHWHCALKEHNSAPLPEAWVASEGEGGGLLIPRVSVSEARGVMTAG